MIDGLSFTLALGCLVATVTVGVRLVGRRYRWADLVPVLALLELGLIVQAVLAGIGLVGGHRPDELPVLVAYLVTSVLVVPVAVVQVRGDDDAWSAAVVLTALVVVAVVVVRAQTTWRTA